MESLSRGRFIASVVGGALGLASWKSSSAQDASQITSNAAQIVATGNVHLGQNASASQNVRGAGTTQGGVFSTGVQVTTNDGRIVATGDVYVDQNAAASQTVYGGSVGGDGCYPGEVAADPSTGQLFYCDNANCWQRVRCGGCR